MGAYDSYPSSVLIDGEEYEVYTDFRNWLRLVELSKDDELSLEEKMYIYARFYKDKVPSNPKTLVNGLIRFMLNGEKTKDKKKSKRKKKVVDYVIDRDYIVAGFLQAYNIDLMEVEYMHWYKFQALFRALPSDTEIMQRIRYRSMDASKIKNREERARIRRIQLDIDLPQEEMTDEEIGNAFMF